MRQAVQVGACVIRGYQRFTHFRQCTMRNRRSFFVLLQGTVREDTNDLLPDAPPSGRCHGGQVAQSVEQRTENPCVECSIHSLPTP